MSKQLQFSIQGEYITNIAREKAIYEGNIPKAIEILIGCLYTQEIPFEKRLLYCLMILNEKARIAGTYPNDDYRLVIDDETETDLQKELTILLQQNTTKQQKIQSDYNKLLQQYNFLLKFLNLSEYKQREIDDAYYEEYNEHIFDIHRDENPVLSTMVSEYIERQKSNTTDDYGWLEPNGTYHPVEWGDHQEWAINYLEKHHPYANDKTLYHTDKNKNIAGGDVLIYKLHWILIHNPSQGIGHITKDPSFEPTKAQKEFLYNYYIERNRNKEANELYANNNK